jgi:hypothetical protein
LQFDLALEWRDETDHANDRWIPALGIDNSALNPQKDRGESEQLR